MRVERIVLKDHRKIAFFWLKVANRFSVDENLAIRNRFQPGDHAQCRGLPAARGADEHSEFVVGHLQIDAVEHLNLAIALHKLFKVNNRHVPSQRAMPASPLNTDTRSGQLNSSLDMETTLALT